jgi:hypothetical protein
VASAGCEPAKTMFVAGRYHYRDASGRWWPDDGAGQP